MRRLFEWLMVAAITVVLMVALLEVGLRLFAPQTSPEMSADLGKGLYAPDSKAVYANARSVSVPMQTAAFSIIARTNSQGLRQDDDIGSLQQGVTRLLCLGDSFAFGWGVQANEAYPALLDGSQAADHTRIESLNGGVNGYGTDNEAAWLGEHGWQLQPKIVLVGFFVGNDVSDVILGMHKTTLDSEGRLILATVNDAGGEEKGLLGGLKLWLARNSHAYIFLRSLAHDATQPSSGKRTAPLAAYDPPPLFYKKEPSDITDGWARVTFLLDEMRKDAQAHGARLVVVAIPMAEQVDDALWRDLVTRFGLKEEDLDRYKPQRRLAEWGSQSGVPVIDLLPGFRKASNGPFYFRTDPHWNPAGHALAAGLIKAELVHLGLLGY